MRIFDKMFLLSYFSYFGSLWVLGALHFPFILIISLGIPFSLQCLMLGNAWQKEEDEANKVTNNKRFPPLPSDIQEEYEYWRND